MTTFLTLLNREIKSYFYSPIAYVVLFYFFVLMGFNAWFLLSVTNGVPLENSLVQQFFSSPVFWFPFILMFPLITMRVFSEEFRMGTIEPLTTAPVTDAQILLSKLFATFLFSCLLLAPSLIFFFAYGHASKHEMANAVGAYWTTYSLLILLSLFYCSIGCLASVFTSDQVIAAIASFAIITLLLFMGFIFDIGQVSNPIARELQSYISPIAHMTDFSKGVVDSRPLVYYLSMTALVVLLTFHVLQYRKWSDRNPAWLLWYIFLGFGGLIASPFMKKNSGGRTGVSLERERGMIGMNVLLQLVFAVVIVVFVNYLSFRHFKRWDFSRDHQYALSSQTKNLLHSLDKPVRAIVFFTSADEIRDAQSAAAAQILPDLRNLLSEYQYASGKKFTYEVVDPYRNLPRAKELVEKYKVTMEGDNAVILDYGGKSKLVNAPDMEEVEMPDQMQMMMGSQPRVKAFKGEAALTSALLELTSGKPNRIYFVTGHGEPDVTGKNAADFGTFTDLLKRQNIQIASVSLLEAGNIPDDAKALIVYGPKHDLSELEIKLIDGFWQKKGSLLICLNPFAKTPNLSGWLSAQCVTPQDDRVIGLANFVAMNEKTNLPEFSKGITVRAAFTVPGDSPITKDEAGATGKFIDATQSLLLDQGKARMTNLRLTPLLVALKDFWGETDLGDDLTKSTYDRNKDHGGPGTPLTLAVSVEKGAMQDPQVKLDTSRLVVIGNPGLLSNEEAQFSQGISGDFAINSLNWLTAHEEAIGIPAKEKKTTTITLSQEQLGWVAGIAIGLIPGLVIAIGAIVWLFRRS